MHKKTWHQQQVEKFMENAGQLIPKRPIVPGEDTCLLRAKLIFEEAMETIEALGVVIRDEGGDVIDRECMEFEVEQEPDIIEIVDGCCDIKVVTTGTLSAFGIADVEPQQEVDASNLRKFAAGGYRREDGKWMKPPNWEPPNLMKCLKDQGYSGK